MHKWFGLYVFVFLVGAFLSGVVDQVTLNLTDAEYLAQVTGYKVATVNDIGVFGIINPFSDFWTEFLPHMMNWDHAFLKGNYSWLREFILIPASWIFYMSLFALFAQGVMGFFRR